MGEPEESEIHPELRKFLLGVLAFLIFVVVGSMLIQFIPGDSHPPRVDFVRNPMLPTEYHIRYLGGIDEGFVGDFKVIVKEKTIKDGFRIVSEDAYKNPGVGGEIAIVTMSSGMCINVTAYDRAIQTYRPIGDYCPTI